LINIIKLKILFFNKLLDIFESVNLDSVYNSVKRELIKRDKAIDKNIKKVENMKNKYEEEIHISLKELQEMEDKIKTKYSEKIKKINIKKDQKVANLITAKDALKEKKKREDTGENLWNIQKSKSK
jgi:predicted component of viral defense system (DUF524 family)